MKILTIILLLSLSLCSTAQDKVIGCYRDYFGNRIQLYADNTFKYTWNFDLSASWTKGVWTQKNDTVFFRMVPTYDTLSHLNSNNFTVDTLILSDDEIPENDETGMNGKNVIPFPDTETRPEDDSDRNFVLFETF